MSGHRAAGGADADGPDEAGGRHRGREVRAEGRGEERDHQRRAGGDRHAAVQVCAYKAANITTYVYTKSKSLKYFLKALVRNIHFQKPVEHQVDPGAAGQGGAAGGYPGRVQEAPHPRGSRHGGHLQVLLRRHAHALLHPHHGGLDSLF